MFHHLVKIISTVLILTTLPLPALGDPPPGKGKEKWEQKDKGGKSHNGKHQPFNADGDWWKSVGPHVNGGTFHVPPGHRPPPGMCRLWYPGVPPGHQPPPEDCSQIKRTSGAYIIYGERGYDPGYSWHREDPALRQLPHVLLDILLDQIR